MSKTISLKEAAELCRGRLGLRLSQETLGRYIRHKFPHLGDWELIETTSGYMKRRLTGLKESRWRNYLAARRGVRNAGELFSDSEV
jgi:hypothetical protein